MTTPTLRQAAQALADTLQNYHYGRMPDALKQVLEALRAALAAPEPVDPVPVVARRTIHQLLALYDECQGDWCKLARRMEDDHLAAIAAKDLEIAALAGRCAVLQDLRMGQADYLRTLQQGMAALKADAA